MSNKIDSPTEELTVWRKRIYFRRTTLQRLVEEAKTTVRTPEGMIVYIIEEYFKRWGKNGSAIGSNNE